MSNSRYYIVGNNDVWMIQFKDIENGQYKSSNEAASFAIAAAQKLRMRGERTHVCALDDDGRFRTRWTYDRDRPSAHASVAHSTFPDAAISIGHRSKFRGWGLTGRSSFPLTRGQ
jgi:hypothetical protein